MSTLIRLSLTACGFAALIGIADSYAQGAQGENFSAKPPAVLFNSDCTGSGCHSGPQGLAKGKSAGDLASYLREHYTNSRQSAAALAAYLASVPGANNARAARPAQESSARGTSDRESTKRKPAAREEAKPEESQSIFSGFPQFPFFSAPSSPPETTKRNEAPARPRSSTARRDEAAKPTVEGEGARPVRSRARPPANQLPKIEDPNFPSENEIYRPARPQPASESEAKPVETTATNVPANVPENTANVSSTTSPRATAPLTPRSPLRPPSADAGNAVPADTAKPPKSRASQRPPAASVLVPPMTQPSESQSAPSGESTSSVPRQKPHEPIFD